MEDKKLEKKKMILAIAGIAAVVFLGFAILFSGHGMGGYAMRGAVPYVTGHGHGGFGYHH